MSLTTAARIHRISRNLGRLMRSFTSSKTRRRPFMLFLVPPLILLGFVLYRTYHAPPSNVSVPPTFSAATQNERPLRIVLTVPTFTNDAPLPYPLLNIPPPPQYSSSSLNALLSSLIDAQYPIRNTHLDVILAPASNPTTFTAMYTQLTSVRWPHGPYTIQNATSGGLFDFPVSSWSPQRGDTQPALIIDASRTAPLQPSFPSYLLSSRRMYSFSDVAGFALHPVTGSQPLLSSTKTMLYQTLPHVPAFSPVNADVWRTFQRWFFAYRGEWFLWPTVVGAKDKKDPSWDNYRGTGRAHWTLWFSRFCVEYGLYTVYPKSRTLAEVSGDSSTPSAVERFSFDWTLISKKTGISDDNLERIVSLAHQQGGSVSMTVVNDAFLETARSWICNVDVAEIRPPGVVWIATDEVAYNGLKDINNSYAILMDEFRGGQSKLGTSYGTPGYWLLMLERTKLILSLLDRGVGIFAFETDQIWLRDPVPFVRRLVSSGDEVDVVGTLDTRHEIGGNFLYLNPTLATRRVWREVYTRFKRAYKMHKMDQHSAKYKRYMENDQSTLTKLIFFDEAFKARNPVVFRALDTELFVDGRWYDKEGKYYRSEKSKSPIVINNNFLIGIANKKQRAIEHDHWFLTENKCNVGRIRKAIYENEARGNVRQSDGSVPTKTSKVAGVDLEVDMKEAISAIRRENQSH